MLTNYLQEKHMEVLGYLMCQMIELELEDISIRDLSKVTIVNMFHKDIVYVELHYNQHHFLLDKVNNLKINNKINIHNKINTLNKINIISSTNNNNSFNNNNFNLLLILINNLLIKVQLLEHPQLDQKTKTSASFH